MKGYEAWGNYVDRFGLLSVPTRESGPEMNAAVAQAYSLSAYSLVNLAALGNKENQGFPRDIPGQVARRWLTGFTSELARRTLQTLEQPATKSSARRILTDGLTGGPKPLMLVEPKMRRNCIVALWPAFIEQIPPGSRQANFDELCESVSATYAELGLAGQEKELFGLLNKPDVARVPAPVRLPRASELDSKSTVHPERPK